MQKVKKFVSGNDELHSVCQWPHENALSEVTTTYYILTSM